MEPQDMDLDSLSMPVLETMVKGEGFRRAEVERGPRTASEVYDCTRDRGAVLQPSPVAGASGDVRRPWEAMADAVVPKVRTDLNWYDEYRQQKEDGKWGVDVEKKKDTELKSILSDKSGRGYSLGGSTPRMKPTQYDGLTPYEDYRVQFHMVAELNGWDKPTKALYLAGCLSKGARSVLNDLKHEDRYEFDKLDEALRDRYGTDDQAELFKAKLRSRIKNKDESLQELAHDIKRLVRLAYPKAALQTHEDLTKDQFIEALGDGVYFKPDPKILLRP
jgi:hypothetical protein